MAELAAGYALNRFEGLNNEPDMEAPWAYHYAGRPDRTAEVVHAVVGTCSAWAAGPARQRRLRWLELLVRVGHLGLFPVAGQNIFLVNAPSFARSRVSWW